MGPSKDQLRTVCSQVEAVEEKEDTPYALQECLP